METPLIQVHHGEVPLLPGFIRFVALSDTHNKASNLQIPAGDVLLHSGDFSRRGKPDEIQEFEHFLSSLPHRHKIIIAGNHDLSFDLENQNSLRLNFPILSEFDANSAKSILKSCIYLEDSYCVIANYKIYGSPWTPTYCDMGFNLDRGANIASKWNLIPDDTEILMTHGPPKGILDLCSNGINAGCEELLAKVTQISPLLHVFGHVHEAYGVYSRNGITFINASNCNMEYQPTNLPFVFDLPLKELKN